MRPPSRDCKFAERPPAFLLFVYVYEVVQNHSMIRDLFCLSDNNESAQERYLRLAVSSSYR